MQDLSKEKFEAAIESCQQALNAYQQIKDRSGEAKSMTNLGIAYLNSGQSDQGILTLEKSLIIAREIGERRVETITLLQLGGAYISLEKTQQGREFLQQALTIAQEIGETDLAQSIQQILSFPQKIEADRLLQQGIQQAQTSQYREAMQSWQKALKIYREIDDRNGEAYSLNNLGLVYDSLGQYPKAIEYHQQSLAIFEEIGDRNGEAYSLNNLGLVYDSNIFDLLGFLRQPNLQFN